MPLIQVGNHGYPNFVYYVPPKTASTSIIAGLQAIYPQAKVQYDKHGIYSTPTLEKMYAFTSVRNPYSRIVSLWQFFEHDTPFGMFVGSERLANFTNKLWHCLPQSWWMHARHGREFDFVVRFEHLDLDFASLCKQLHQIAYDRYKSDMHLVLPSKLSHLNKTGEWTNVRGVAVKRDRPWWEYYEGTRGERDASIVRELYSSDFRIFNYSDRLEDAIPAEKSTQ